VIEIKLKLFRVTCRTSPEWGQDYDVKSWYFLALDTKTVREEVRKRHGKGGWCEYDRAETTYSIEEVAVELLQGGSEDEDHSGLW
jgi:hypothetical protein